VLLAVRSRNVSKVFSGLPKKMIEFSTFSRRVNQASGGSLASGESVEVASPSTSVAFGLSSKLLISAISTVFAWRFTRCLRSNKVVRRESLRLSG